MSSAFYPLGMNSYNNRSHQGGYQTWKGRGVYSNPVGITSGNLRPLTNNDPANDAIYKVGSARPLKQYRRGISIPVPVPLPDPNNPGAFIESYYYSNRQVKSSVQDKMISQMLDTPGRYSVKENKVRNDNLDNNLNEDCKTCNGVGIVSNWFPINNLTEKPQPNVTKPLLCCNQQRKARRRVLPASTILKKNYYTTTSQYLYNRCQTFEQRSFNFVSGTNDPNVFNTIKENPYVSDAIIENTKPGEPLSYLNLYVANCNPNFRITQSVYIETINLITSVLLDKNIIDQTQYDTIVTSNVGNIADFINVLKLLPDLKKYDALTIADSILYNPYNGPLIQGPSNPKGCAQVYYKPNNPTFAQQGAVSSSTRNLYLNVTTIEKNAASIRKENAGNVVINRDMPFTSPMYKNKAPKCKPKTCFRNTGDSSDTNPVSTYNNTVNQLSDMTSIVNVTPNNVFGV